MDETIWLEIKLSREVKLLVIIVYRSPNSTIKNNSHLIDTIGEIDKRNYPHKIIAGDFNLPKISWADKGPETGMNREFSDSIDHCFLYQHVKTPKRARGEDNPSLVDLIITKDINCINEIEHASPSGKSDHSLLKITNKHQF